MCNSQLIVFGHFKTSVGNKDMSGSNNTASVMLQLQESSNQIIPLKLKKSSTSHKQINWDVEIIDNEHLNKKKSKCCYIHKKPN